MDAPSIKIVINIKGQSIELTRDELVKLRAELDALLGPSNSSTYPFHPRPPVAFRRSGGMGGGPIIDVTPITEPEPAS